MESVSFESVESTKSVKPVSLETVKSRGGHHFCRICQQLVYDLASVGYDVSVSAVCGVRCNCRKFSNSCRVFRIS